MNIEEIKKMHTEGVRCIINKGEDTIIIRDGGIGPLLSLAEKRRDLDGCRALDTVVGKAAAMLYTVIGCIEIHAIVLSKGGEEILKRYGIKYSYEAKTENIVNRKGDGICPMENAVMDINDPSEAVVKLRETLESLKKNNI